MVKFVVWEQLNKMLSRRLVCGVSSARSIHTTSVKSGFMDWFSWKQKEDEKAVEKAEPTKSYIEKLENKSIKPEEELLHLDNIEFIGLKTDPREKLPLEQRLKGFRVKPWLNKTEIKDLEQFKQLLLKKYEKMTGKQVTLISHIDLTDLEFRFKYTTEIQKLAGFIIPDLVLTQSYKGTGLVKFFEEEVLTGRIHKRFPDVKTVDEYEFTAPNISIKKRVTLRARKLKLQAIEDEMNKRQELVSNELMKNAKQSTVSV